SLEQPEQTAAALRLQLRRQNLLHHNPRPQQPRLHHTLVDAEYGCGFDDIVFLHITQNQYFPVHLWQALQRRVQQLPQFLSLQRLQRNLAPVGDDRRSEIALFLWRRRIHGLKRQDAVVTKLRPSFVEGDRNQPSSELRLPAEAGQVLKRFQYRLLGDIFGIVFVLQHGIRCEIDAALVRQHQLVKQI